MVSPAPSFLCASWAVAAGSPEVPLLPQLFPAALGPGPSSRCRRRQLKGNNGIESTANMSSKRAKTKTTKKRPQRATSNVFAMFDQSQIQEFKEAFNMIDQNRDGFIDKEDLHDMLASLGKNPTDEYLDAMMNEAPGPINFTMFLTMFGEKLNGTDPEDVIRNAFACFDEEATGFIQEDYLRELLTTMGDRFTDEEVDELYREAPIDKKGNFNYIEFTRILKHGAKDKDD
ncbi:PREDICTED: myosin regulatory light chain 2, smooth muscle minor isoform isoform X1 [Haliaeetus leucocephalus]|uniref:myosin regulatory light chain 2, smooth muscle minor isoform isoform X1 n=1 Tax=Haliaeetus leucocephalus TaxID=52644 RepID=UPI00053CAD4C|nr:PREDICTED: myosin regulatory light chain 2, smooth muscle minor isoform isoform X1 [Haliaeetus leucocephalus]